MNRSYQEIIADEIHAAGWSYGYRTEFDVSLGTCMYVADAHKEGRMRFVARAETLQTALIELRAMTADDDRHRDTP